MAQPAMFLCRLRPVAGRSCPLHVFGWHPTSSCACCAHRQPACKCHAAKACLLLLVPACSSVFLPHTFAVPTKYLYSWYSCSTHVLSTAQLTCVIGVCRCHLLTWAVVKMRCMENCYYQVPAAHSVGSRLGRQGWRQEAEAWLPCQLIEMCVGCRMFSKE